MSGPALDGVRLVSWDVDGTLYPLRALKRRIVLDCLGQVLRVGPLAARRELLAVEHHHLATEAARAGDARVEAAMTQCEQAEVFQRAVHRAVAQLRMSPRALELLERIAGAGIPQVVLSDYVAQPKVASLGLESHFQAFYACAELGHWKPSPMPFHEVERRHGVPSPQHLHIGDRLDTDGEGARRAGCRFFQLVA